MPRRLRPILVPVAAAAAISAAAFGTGCAGNGPNHRSSERTDAKPTTTLPPTVKLTIASDAATAIGPGTTRTLDPAVARAAGEVVNKYFRVALATPLRTGKLGVGAFTLFTPDAAAQLRPGTTGRDVVTDLGLARPTESMAITGTLHLHGLLDSAGTTVMVAANVHTVETVRAKNGTQRARRAGQLLLTPAADGRWLIAGFDMRTVRSATPTGRSTTTAPPTTTRARSAP